jgi:hypothetical protein
VIGQVLAIWIIIVQSLRWAPPFSVNMTVAILKVKVSGVGMWSGCKEGDHSGPWKKEKKYDLTVVDANRGQEFLFF